MEDLESIVDADIRATAEKASLLFGRKLVLASYSGIQTLKAESLDSPEGVSKLAKEYY